MAGAVCPSCGVAVVPGYTRCPKCHASLPSRRLQTSVGGTSVRSSRFPFVPVIAGVAVLGVIAVIALRGGKHPASTSQAAPEQADQPTTAPTVETPGPTESTSPPPATGPSAETVASDLERSLKHQRLWSTVQVRGATVEVRSGSCAEPAMKSALDASAGPFKAAGLTKLRCLEQSGSLVFDRDL